MNGRTALRLIPQCGAGRQFSITGNKHEVTRMPQEKKSQKVVDITIKPAVIGRNDLIYHWAPAVSSPDNIQAALVFSAALLFSGYGEPRFQYSPQRPGQFQTLLRRWIQITSRTRAVALAR